jgi:hypothetical protein
MKVENQMMDWEKVADHLSGEAGRLWRDGPSAFPNDFQTQEEMRTRAAIFQTFADAIRAGIKPKE